MSETLQQQVKRLTSEGFYPGRVEFVQKDELYLVAVIGQVCDWAVYRGKKNWNVTMTKEHGDKVGEKLAKALFPEFEKLDYRE